jgi:branched-chain amino acid transport system permease protein
LEKNNRVRAASVCYLAAGLFALAVPVTGIYPVFMMKLLCFAIFACAYNLLLGFSGMLSFGHAAFFGSAAYITGWLATAHGWGTGPATLAGVAVAMVLGLAIGALAIRRRGIYFAMITLALAQLLLRVLSRRPSRAGRTGCRASAGALLGIVPLRSDLPILPVLGRSSPCSSSVAWCTPVRAGAKAIRENESRAISWATTCSAKLVAFVLSATLAGLAGALKTLVLGFVTLSDVSQATSGEVILMTLVGGTGTFFGPVIGAAVTVTLQEYLSDIVGGWVTVIIGAIFIACVLVFRRGIVGEFAALRPRRLSQS